MSIKTITTDTQWSDWTTSYAGDFAADFDIDAIKADYLDAINALLPEGVSMHANGDVYGPRDFDAEGFSLSDIYEQIDASAIFQAHAHA